VRAAIGLGGNLGDRRGLLELGLLKLSAHPALCLLRCSRWVRTPPLPGGSASGWFLNGVALFSTELPPHVLLGICQSVEALAGRRPARRWGDRPLDLDLLLLEDTVMADPLLTLPHPAIPQRAFVLQPLLEVWPDANDPRTGVSWSAYPKPAGPRPVPVGVVARPPGRLYQSGPLV